MTKYNISGQKVILSLFIINAAIVFSGGEAKSIAIDKLENYVRYNYLAKDKKYGKSPINNFKSLISVKQLLPKELPKKDIISAEIIALDDGIFKVILSTNNSITVEKVEFNDLLLDSKIHLSEVIQKVNLQQNLHKDIFFTEILQTKYGTYLSYRLNKLQVLSSKISIDDLTDSERLFCEGFIFIRNGSILTHEFAAQKVDPENELYSRSLWDIFEYENHLIFLIFKREYESHGFEIYSIESSKIKLLKEFQFGGL